MRKENDIEKIAEDKGGENDKEKEKEKVVN